jgi:hypothetical protein
MEAYEIIRELFAKTIQAKERGYTTSHFSFNSPEGRCDLCQGEGYVKIEIALLFACAYLALMIHADLVVHVQNQCKYSFGGFGPTEVRIVGVIFAGYMYFAEVKYFDILGHMLTQYDFGVLAISIIMMIILIVSIIKKGIELDKLDTLGWKK